MLREHGFSRHVRETGTLSESEFTLRPDAPVAGPSARKGSCSVYLVSLGALEYHWELDLYQVNKVPLTLMMLTSLADHAGGRHSCDLRPRVADANSS